MGPGELRDGAHERDLHGGGGRGQARSGTRRQERTADLRGQHRTAGSDAGRGADAVERHDASFSGTASESLPVTVKVYKGSESERLAGGERGSDRVGRQMGARSAPSPALTSGTYTAVAEEDSSLGNATGQERTADVRGQHRTAGSDADSAINTALESHETDVQRDSERSRARDRARVPGQRSKRHRSRRNTRVTAAAPGEWEVGGLAGARATGTTRRSPPSRARSATPTARAKRGDVRNQHRTAGSDPEPA